MPTLFQVAGWLSLVSPDAARAGKVWINCSRPMAAGALGSLRQLALDLCRRCDRFAPQNEIEKPNNKAIDRENEHGSKTRMMPSVAYFEGDEGRGRKYHQEFRPPLLHVNADSFGKKNCRVKKRQKTGGMQRTARQNGLQFIEQVGDSPAVLQEDFVGGPV